MFSTPMKKVIQTNLKVMAVNNGVNSKEKFDVVRINEDVTGNGMYNIVKGNNE